MNPSEYANLDAIEQAHWYYVGKRELVRWWLDRTGPLRADDRLLDCGAGTGRFALELKDRCRVLVLDDHEEALRLLRARFSEEQVICLADGTVPLADNSLSYVTALDVLEHVRDDVMVVQGFHRMLQPGGVAIVTVPASMALWSDWDEALHHFRRYERRHLQGLFNERDWEIVHVNYTNVLVYPVVWLVRRWRQIRAHKGGAQSQGPRTEDRLPPSWVNSVLRRVFVGMGKVRVPFPFGVSLLLVARKR